MEWLSTLFQSIVFQTVIAGVLVFVLKELIQEFILSPIKKYKEVVGKIDNRLKYYTNIITNAGLSQEIVLESSKTMRELSCELEAVYRQLVAKKFLSFIRVIPPHKMVSESAVSLIRLSNAGGQQGREGMNCNEIALIRKNLKIEDI